MKITANKAELLAKLQENRDKHREVFEDALEGYYIEVKKTLEQQMERVRARKKPDMYLPYSIPKDHTSDYDRIIGMLRMHQGESFELTEGEYAQYVNDNWAWTGEWRKTVSSYSLSNSGKFGEIYGESEGDN